MAEEIEYGSDRKVIKQKKEESIRRDEREKVLKELGDKVTVRNNQPTNLDKVRVAGGDDKPETVQDTWTTGKGALPG